MFISIYVSRSNVNGAVFLFVIVYLGTVYAIKDIVLCYSFLKNEDVEQSLL